MAVKNIYKTIIVYCIFSVSQSSLRWDIETSVIYGQNATLFCNGDGCMPTNIRKWIGGPTYDVLCFDNYSSNPAKYDLRYNKTTPSFELMIKNFNFTDANCEYTCACGFLQYTHILELEEINFVYPPDKDLTSEINHTDGKLHINMSMKVYPLPSCTISYGDIVLPVETELVDFQEKVGINLYHLKLIHILHVENKYCRENLSVSCTVRSFAFQLLQQKLDLCKDHPDSFDHLFWIFLGLTIFVTITLLVMYMYVRKGRHKTKSGENTLQDMAENHQLTQYNTDNE